MEVFQILTIGFGSGLLLSVLSIALFNSVNSERYPLGGFFPVLWLVTDLGGSSQLMEGGWLIMGGLLGYYLVLACWRGKPESLACLLPEASTADHPDTKEAHPAEARDKEVIRSKSLADFL